MGVAAPAAFSFAPVGAVASHSVVKSVEVTPAEVSHEVTAHAVPVAVGYHGFGYYGKREAEADPAVIAGRTTVLSAPTPLIHNPPVRPVVHHPVVAAPAVAAVGYAGLGYHGLGYGLPLAHAVVKREADPQVLASPLRCCPSCRPCYLCLCRCRCPRPCRQGRRRVPCRGQPRGRRPPRSSCRRIRRLPRLPLLRINFSSLCRTESARLAIDSYCLEILTWCNTALTTITVVAVVLFSANSKKLCRNTGINKLFSEF